MIFGRPHRTSLQHYGGPGPVSGPYGWQVAMDFDLAIVGPFLPAFQPPVRFQACQKDDVGVALTITVLDQDGNPIDLRAATLHKLRIQYPDGSGREVAASLVAGGAGGQISYTTVSGDLPQVGLHTVQARLTLASQTVYTQEGTFEVLANVTVP